MFYHCFVTEVCFSVIKLFNLVWLCWSQSSESWGFTIKKNNFLLNDSGDLVQSGSSSNLLKATAVNDHFVIVRCWTVKCLLTANLSPQLLFPQQPKQSLFFRPRNTRIGKIICHPKKKRHPEFTHAQTHTKNWAFLDLLVPLLCTTLLNAPPGCNRFHPDFLLFL